jgi:hypothetical protein
MKALLITVNGQRICLAGIEGPGVLATNVTWVSRLDHEGFSFAVSRLGRDGVRADWDVPTIAVGDTVTITISEVAEFDPPQHSGPPATQS